MEALETEQECSNFFAIDFFIFIFILMDELYNHYQCGNYESIVSHSSIVHKLVFTL